MATNPQNQQPPQPRAGQEQGGEDQQDRESVDARHADTDGLKDKKPDELTPEELRLMADTMPGEGPGD